MKKKLLMFIFIIIACIFSCYAINISDDKGLMIRDNVVLKWNKHDLPIPCFYLDADADLLQAYNYAVYNVINRELGFKAYLRCSRWAISEPIPNNGNLLLTYRYTTKRGGSTILSYDKKTGRIVGLNMRIDYGLDKHVLRKVMVHELLHGLGLEEDTADTIMYPKLKHLRIEISNNDLTILKRIYKK